MNVSDLAEKFHTSAKYQTILVVKLSTKYMMNRHVASVHERKKPFKCEICDFSASQKSVKDLHVAAVHEGKKPFKCENCDYRSASK